jgi:hypothetical protein
MNIELQLIDMKLYIKDLQNRVSELEKQLNNQEIKESKEESIRKDKIERELKKQEDENIELQRKTEEMNLYSDIPNLFNILD